MGTTPSGMDHTSYCKDFVRQHDYASYLISQFYPKDAQSGYFALKAFSVRIRNPTVQLSSLTFSFKVELALVQDAVSSPMVGKMRMQFWRDAIKQISEVRRRGMY